MRVAAIFGLGCSPEHLRPFQNAVCANSDAVGWHIGIPAAADQTDVILLFGGDGTIHRHLPQLIKLNRLVLIIPIGSGNDFARALGLRSTNDSLLAWRRYCAGDDNVKAIDLGTIRPLKEPDAKEMNGADRQGDDSNAPQGDQRHYFASVAGVGLDCEVARRANALPRWLRGHGGYALSLIPSVFQFAPFLMKISIQDGDNWVPRSHQPTLLAAFANSSTYGSGMKIAPHAKPDDGQLDVCVIGGIDPFKLFCLFPTVYFGRHLKIRKVEYFRAARLRLETEHPLDVYADGEFVCHTPVEIGIQTAALRVIEP
jgi:diacylglycerol kinase (ATP)